MPSPPTASEFKLSDAVAHLNSQTAGKYQLWAFYTATVLGSLVLALSRQMTVLSASIVLCGFWTFALGELALLRRTMLIINEIRAAITDRLSKIDDKNIDSYRPALSAVASNWNPIWIAVVVQFVGDLCVTALMIGNSIHLIPVS